MAKNSKRRPFVLHTRVVTGTCGGPEKTILNSPRFLKPYGIDSACLFMRPPEDPGFLTLEAKAHAAGAEIIGVDDTGPFDRNVVKECIRVCHERNVDIWHAHDYKSNALGLLVKRFHDMKLVTTAHGWVRFTRKTPLYYWIDRFSMKRYDQVVCVSQDLEERCRGIRIPEHKLSLIDNAIVVDDYDPSPPTGAERSRFGFGSDAVILGACGRLSEEKGFDLLINAISHFVRNGQNIGLVIAGEGHLREELQRQIDELRLQNNVCLAGFLADPRQLYRAIDIFVLSSLREGLPNVVLEAMASKRPLVATNCNSVPRLVTNGENGIVVDCNNEDQLYRGIRTYIESPETAANFATAGRQTVEEKFSFHRRMDRMVAVYRSLGSSLALRIEARPIQQSSAQLVEAT